MIVPNVLNSTNIMFFFCKNYLIFEKSRTQVVLTSDVQIKDSKLQFKLNNIFSYMVIRKMIFKNRFYLAFN